MFMYPSLESHLLSLPPCFSKLQPHWSLWSFSLTNKIIFTFASVLFSHQTSHGPLAHVPRLYSEATSPEKPFLSAFIQNSTRSHHSLHPYPVLVPLSWSLLSISGTELINLLIVLSLPLECNPRWDYRMSQFWVFFTPLSLALRTMLGTCRYSRTFVGWENYWINGW